MAAASIYGSLTYGSISPAVAALFTNHQEGEKKEAVQRTPHNAPVAATFELLSALSTREHVYSLHYGLLQKNQYALTDYRLPEDTEYLAIDFEDILKTQMHIQNHHAFAPYAENFQKNLWELLTNFELLHADGPVTVWRRSRGTSDSKDALVTKADVFGSEPVGMPDPSLIDEKKYDDRLLLTFLIPDRTEQLRNYYITIATPERTFSVPLAYGMYSLVPEQHAQHFTMPIFISPEEQETLTLTLYRWNNGSVALGPLKNLVVKSDSRELWSITMQPDIP